MTETSVLHVQCENCNHSWYPYGRFQQVKLPHEETITCPKCNNQQFNTWYDSETEKLLSQQRLGLLSNPEQEQKIKNLEHKIELLGKEVELEKKKRELFEIELEKLNNWAEAREEDFRHIELLAQDLDDEHNFREENK